MFEKWEKAKKVWAVLGTFGIVKPVGLLSIGVLASGGVEAAARSASQTLHWVFGILAGLAGVGVAVLTYTVRRQGIGLQVVYLRPEPEAPPPPRPQPEPWTWTAEVVQAAPAALDPPRVFIAGAVISREDVPYETTKSA